MTKELGYKNRFPEKYLSSILNTYLNRRFVHFKIEMVRIICNEKVAGKTLVAGFLGLGHVGYLSIDHMIYILKAKRVGFVETIHVPPFITVKGQDFTTPFEIYSNKETLFFRCEAVPSGRGGNMILGSLMEWAKGNKVKKVILIGGLSTSFKKEGEKDEVRYLYNHYYKDLLGEIDPYVQDGVQVVGPLAVIIYYTEMYALPALAILAYADSTRVDPRGAANAVTALAGILGVEVDTKELMNKALSIEKEIDA